MFDHVGSRPHSDRFMVLADVIMKAIEQEWYTASITSVRYAPRDGWSVCIRWNYGEQAYWYPSQRSARALIFKWHYDWIGMGKAAELLRQGMIGQDEYRRMIDLTNSTFKVPRLV
jgi:hypothetical protein